jgi:hypothetical protein
MTPQHQCIQFRTLLTLFSFLVHVMCHAIRTLVCSHRPGRAYCNGLFVRCDETWGTQPHHAVVLCKVLTSGSLRSSTAGAQVDVPCGKKGITPVNR